MQNCFYCCILTILFFICKNGEGFDGGFRQVALDLHNVYRSRYKLAPLNLDSVLNIVAHTHAEKLANTKSFYSSGRGYGDKENLWAYIGPLRPLAADTTDAVNSWFLGTNTPGNTISYVQQYVLRSNETKLLGIGVGTSDDYTVVVANYLNY